MSINLGQKKIRIPLNLGKMSSKKKKRFNIVKASRGKEDPSLAEKAYFDQNMVKKYKVKNRKVYERRKLNLPLNNNVFIKHMK